MPLSVEVGKGEAKMAKERRSLRHESPHATPARHACAFCVNNIKSATPIRPPGPQLHAIPQEVIQEKYNMLAIQLSLLVAILYTSVGVFRLGFLTNFLSHSVIGGFTSGAAITIGAWS